MGRSLLRHWLQFCGCMHLEPYHCLMDPITQLQTDMWIYVYKDLCLIFIPCQYHQSVYVQHLFLIAKPVVLVMCIHHSGYMSYFSWVLCLLSVFIVVCWHLWLQTKKCYSTVNNVFICMYMYKWPYVAVPLGIHMTLQQVFLVIFQLVFLLLISIWSHIKTVNGYEVPMSIYRHVTECVCYYTYSFKWLWIDVIDIKRKLPI